jgi:Yip1 domain
MANTTSEPGVASASAATQTAGMSLLARCIGIITAPKPTFEAVVAHPKWLGALAIVTIVVAVGVSLPLTTEGGQQSQLDNQVRAIESFGGQVDDRMYGAMRESMRFAAVQTFFTILVAGPLMSTVIAGILFGVFTVLTGGQASFKQLFAVYVHSTIVTAVAQLFIGPLNYFRGSMSSATNLAVLMPMIDEQSFLGKLLGMIDLFWIWWLIVLSIGLGVLYKRRTQSVAYGLFGIYIVGIILVAAVMSYFGRTN